MPTIRAKCFQTCSCERWNDADFAGAYTGLAFFTCSPEDMGGPRFLEADFNVECWTEDHTSWIPVGAVLLVFYAVGIPVLGLGLLFYAHFNGIDEWRNVLGFLFNGFKPNLFYWEIVIMVRKLLFAVISVVFRPVGADIQAYTGIGVITGNPNTNP